MASAFPPPPPYYKLYYDPEDVEGGEVRAPPSPPPAMDGEYQVFGMTYTTQEGLPSLSEQGVHQLYSLEGAPNGPSSRYKSELHKLNRSLLINFMGLLQSLIENPSNSARKVEDIGLLLRNTHHLLNSLRPHQARATLIAMLKSQIEARKAAAQDVRDRREAAVSSLRKALQELQVASASCPEASAADGEAMDVDGVAALPPCEHPAQDGAERTLLRRDTEGLAQHKGEPAPGQSALPLRADGRCGKKEGNEDDEDDDKDELWTAMEALTDEDGCDGTAGPEYPHHSHSVGIVAGRDGSVFGDGAGG